MTLAVRVLLVPPFQEKSVPVIDKEKLWYGMPDAVKERIRQQSTHRSSSEKGKSTSKEGFSDIAPNIDEYYWGKLVDAFGIRNFQGYDVVDISHRSFVAYAQQQGLGEYVKEIQGYNLEDFKQWHIQA